MILQWIRFLLGGGLLLAGLATFIIEMIGAFRFRYILNKMHAAAIGDTLGIGFALLGLIVMSGFNFAEAVSGDCVSVVFLSGFLSPDCQAGGVHQ